MPTDVQTTHIKVLIDGSPLADNIRDTLLSIRTEGTYNRPDECVMTFTIQPGATTHAALDIGKALKLAAKPERAAEVAFFEGEITAVETEFAVDFTTLVVIAHDKLHRLFRCDRNKTYKDVKASDVAGQVASACGLTSQATATSDVHPYLWQHNETDGDFLSRLAGEVNHYLRADASKLVFAKVGAGPASGVELELGVELITFNTRATAKTIVKDVEVRGWDIMKKEPVVGAATGGQARKDSKAASGADDFGANKALLVREGTKAMLDNIAKATIERTLEPNLQVEGECYGDARIKVDTKLAIKGVGTRFSGDYRVSLVRHLYDETTGFRTQFVCRGGTDQSLAGLVSVAAVAEAPTSHVNPLDGVAIGIVTNVDDPEDLGRVRVKLPQIADDQESHWMRTVHLGGGGADKHGWYVLPEVNDEVLVAFEHGDPRLGFVLGGLHNSKDKPPRPKGDVIASGKINQRIFQTRKGAFLLFDDKDGGEAIELKAKNDKFNIRFEEGKGLTVTSKEQGNELLITPEGQVTIKQAKDILIESTSGKLSLKAAMDIDIESTGGKITAKAAMDASLSGMNVKIDGQMNTEVKGGMAAKLEGGVNATVKGAMVMIN